MFGLLCDFSVDLLEQLSVLLLHDRATVEMGADAFLVHRLAASAVKEIVRHLIIYYEETQ